jgi:hypothetical protein
MEKRRRANALEARQKHAVLNPIFTILFSVVLFSPWLGGCAAPGEPVERRPVVPSAVTDLEARQRGNDVILTFTMPKATVQQRPLKLPPATEIYRSIAPVGPNANSNIPTTLLVTIPAGVTDQYLGEKRQIRYVDTLAAQDFSAQHDVVASYVVRTRASAKRVSAESNLVSLPIYPALDPIIDLTAKFSRAGVALKWTAPQKTLIGAASGSVAYHVYRSSAEAGPPAAAAEPSRVKAAPALTQIAAASSAEYVDTNTEFGQTYLYTVRSVSEYGEATLESADSNMVSVTTKDIFPPAVPQGLIVLFVPAQGDAAAHVELSWQINSEADLAGYNVYRSEQVDAPGTRENPELLRTPAFRDMNAIPGRRYFYKVTAVDRSGNESAASAAVSGGAPDESQ